MDDRAPDLVEEVVGWRAWTVIGERHFPLLASPAHKGTVWHPDRWTMATCGVHDRCQKQTAAEDGFRIPGIGCSCGLYAAKTREQLVGLHYGGSDASDFERSPVFIGEVGMAGKVYPASLGWRAEKARVVRLYVPFVCWKWVEPLERLYNVEALVDNTTHVAPRFRFGGR